MDEEHDLRRQGGEPQQQVGDGHDEQQDGAFHNLEFLDPSRGVHGVDDRVRQAEQDAREENQPEEGLGVGRETAEPPGEDGVGFQGERDADEQHQVDGVFGTGHHEAVHPFQVVGCVALGELRVDGHLEVGAEVVGDALHLHGNAAGRVDHRVEEDVQQDVQSLRVAENGQVAVHGPARIAEDVLEQFPVGLPELDVFRLFEMPFAVKNVEGEIECLDGKHVEGIENQLVGRDVNQHKHGNQFQERITQGEVGKGRHLFVGDDGRVEGRAQQAAHGGEDGELVDPHGGVFPGRGDVQLRQHEPQADGFADEEDYPGKQHVNEDDVLEDVLQLREIAFSQVERDVAGGSSCQRVGEKTQEGDDTSHHVVDTKVFYAKGFQNHSGGIEADEHQYTHADV